MLMGILGFLIVFIFNCGFEQRNEILSLLKICNEQNVSTNDPEVWEEYHLQYSYEKKSDNEGHHLILKDVYQKSHIIFTSDHQRGNPIKRITFTFN